MPKVSVEYEQQQRERIIQGAAEAFAEMGYHKTTIDYIADKLKLSKGAIYIYFDSKEKLFEAVFQNYRERQLAAMHRAAESEGTSLQRLEKVRERFIRLIEHRDDVFGRLWLEFYVEGPRVSSIRHLVSATKEQFYQIVYNLLAEGQARGEIKQGLDLASITTVIMATCDGLMLDAVIGEKRREPELIRQAMAHTFSQLLKP